MPSVDKDSSYVTAYYENPVTGKVERHRMTAISFHEASRPRWIQDDRGRPVHHATGEEHLWSREPPPDGAEIADFLPVAYEDIIKSSQPPPVSETAAVDPLRRRRKTA